MDANALTPRDLFDSKICYEIPPFQRPYVWTEEDQWQPLWNDVERVAEKVLAAGGSSDGEVAKHFLGAVVLKQLWHESGDPARRSVIDGQQRLTTLQLLIDAAQLVVEAHGDEDDAESLQELVLNSAKRFASTPKRFKLWPSRVDRPSFECVMDNDLDLLQGLVDSRINAAHRFFQSAVAEWAEQGDEPAAVSRRLSALTEVLQQHLQVVTIDLGDGDDDQLIFETLNDRGTPLLAADLIKNFVFQRCEELGADVDGWAEAYWQDFDSDWWRDQVSQGRLYRSRIDLFLQYWLTMRTRSEVPTDAVFARFREFAGDRLDDQASAKAFLEGLRRDANTFRDLTELDPDSISGRFYSRVVESLELGVFIPLLLWMISDNHAPPQSQIDRALAAVESWAVRRTLLRQTMKNVNLLVVSLLDHLHDQSLDEVGDATVAFLLDQTADARSWPTDDDVRQQLPGIKVYGSIKQQRLRTMLAALEMHLRTERHEEVTLPAKLEIEHVMPRGWRSYWGNGVAHDPELSAKRDAIINTIGNLTLVTQKLNVALSNRPWSDEDALVVAPTGKDAGVGKRSLLGRYSVLVLNKDIVDPHESDWSEMDIEARSASLADAVTQVWSRG